MRFSVLGSGSRGNATLVAAGDTHILADAGFSGREIVRRLARVGVAAADIAAIVLTHEHGDHARGAGIFARAHGVPIFATRGTRHAMDRMLSGTEELHVLRPGEAATIGDLRIDPFATVHDATDPAAISVSDRAKGFRLGIATDLGRPTIQARHALRRCDALVLEANHDEVMLWSAGYPAVVKGRIASSHGHLSNQDAARLAVELLHPELLVVVLAHLSQESNTPALARTVVGGALRDNGFQGKLEVASPDEPTPMMHLPALRDAMAPRQGSLF